MIEIGRTYKGMFRSKKATRIVELVAHGIVYFVDKEYLPEHQIVERCSKKAFIVWMKRNDLLTEAM